MSFLKPSSVLLAERQYAKVCLFDALLLEAPDDGFGTEMDTGEAAAKVKYDAAKAALVDWDANMAKKAAFEKELARLRSTGMGEERARKQLRTDTRFAYNVPLAAKQRKTLEDELDRAESLYAAYNPQERGYRRNRSDAPKRAADKKFPPAGKKALQSLDDISFLTWHPWPKELKKAGISYGSKVAGNDVEQSSLGTGPGEEWLAYVFGAQMQGGGVSYDLVMPDGSAWEVKQLLSQSNLIRPGTEGRKAFEKAKTRLSSVLKQIESFVSVTNRLKLTDAMSQDAKSQFEMVESFINNEYEMFVEKGEVSKERFIDLRATLLTLGKLKDELKAMGSGAADAHGTQTVGLNDKNIPVDKPTYIDVAKRVEKATSRDDVLSDVEEVDIAVSTLKDPAFADPRGFFNEWSSSIRVENVFSQVDGIIVVNPNGFMVIPKDQFRNTIKFNIISQNIPRFSLSVFGSGPK